MLVLGALEIGHLYRCNKGLRLIRAVAAHGHAI